MLYVCSGRCCREQNHVLNNPAPSFWGLVKRKSGGLSHVKLSTRGAAYMMLYASSLRQIQNNNTKEAPWNHHAGGLLQPAGYVCAPQEKRLHAPAGMNTTTFFLCCSCERKHVSQQASVE
jgi:hypothetical protein